MRKILLIIGILLIIVFASGCTGVPIEITNPVNGTTVSQYVTVEGKSQQLGNGENIYVLIKPANYSWWVQREPTLNSDGTWHCEAQIGESRDLKKSFTIAAIITNETLKMGEYGPQLPYYKYKAEINVSRS